MQITQTAFAEAIRFGDIAPAVGQHLYGRNLVRVFEEKYGFVEVPQKASEFDLSKGISFLHGFYKDKYLIDKVQIYNNGILVDTRHSTDICEELIDDIIGWAASKLKIKFTENKNLPRLFVSHFELTSKFDLGKMVTPFHFMQTELSRLLSSYGDVPREFEFSSLSFMTDPGISGPTPFRFERRAGKPFTDDLYFSAAPLRSNDHLGLLQLLEKSLAT